MRESFITYEQEFLKEFEAWVRSQVTINEMAFKESQEIHRKEKDDSAKEAAIRYESRLDAYQFLLGKFANYQAKKGFHDLPDEFFGQRNY